MVWLGVEDPAAAAAADDDVSWNVDDEGRGISVALTPSVADAMRHRRPAPNTTRGRQLQGLSTLPIVSDAEDWECLLPLQTATSDVGEKDVNREKSLDDDGDKDDEYDCNDSRDEDDHDANLDSDDSSNNDDDSDDYTPLTSSSSSMPLILVNVERLTGYVPTDAVEWDELKQTMCAALYYGRSLHASSSSSSSAATPTTTTYPTTSISSHTDDDGNDDTILSEPKPAPAEAVSARDFDERLTELLATGMARHSDTTAISFNNNSIDRYVAIPYPDYFTHENNEKSASNHENNNNNIKNDSIALISTARLWKRLLRPHPVPVVHTLLHQHLRNCSRSLWWKLDMRREIVHLARVQGRRHCRQTLQAEELAHQQHNQKQQLDQLYTVRAALADRVEQALADQGRLEAIRDQTVRDQLCQRRWQQQQDTLGGVGGGGLEAFDLSSTVFAFPDLASSMDDGFLGFCNDDDDEEYADQFENEDDFSNNEDNSCDENDEFPESSFLGNVDEVGEEQVPTFESRAKENDEDCQRALAHLLSHTHTDEENDEETEMQRKERIRRVRRRRLVTRQRRLVEATKEADHQTKLEAAQTEETQIREQCTTHALRVAIAITNELRLKLNQVDEMVETMQEEQWAKEEEEENELSPSEEELENQAEADSDLSQNRSFSLLDQILAMILGACPPPDGTKTEDHIRFLENEHRMILDGWLENFGHLPPAINKTPQPSTDNEILKHPNTASNPTSSERETPICNSVAPEIMRASLGIKDNDQTNWDDDDDEEDM